MAGARSDRPRRPIEPKRSRIANNYEDASRAASNGRLTESQARRVIGDIFAIAHNDILPTATIKGFLEAWLKRKELEADERTHERARRRAT